MLRYVAAAMLCMLAAPVWAVNITLTDKADKYTLLVPGNVYGKKGNDQLTAVNTVATLAGQEGNDILVGRNYKRGYSTLKGGPGDDKLYCDGNGTAFGGPGVDYIEATSSSTATVGGGRLWGGLGRDTFSVFVAAHSRNYSVDIEDFVAEDKLKLYLPDWRISYQPRSIVDIFNVIDVNHDGVFDVNDKGVNWNEWSIVAEPADLATSSPGYIVFITLTDDTNAIVIYGVDRITRAQLVR